MIDSKSLFLVTSSLVSRPDGLIVSAIDIVQASSKAQEIVKAISDSGEVLQIVAMKVELLEVVGE